MSWRKFNVGDKIRLYPTSARIAEDFFTLLEKCLLLEQDIRDTILI